MNESDARFWRREAGRTALRHNLGWWLAYFLPGAAAVSAGQACVLLMARFSAWPTAGIWVGFGAVLVGIGAVAGVRAKPRFLPVSGGLVRLDAELKLHNRLSAAEAGIGAYPSRRPVDDGLRWRWLRVAAFVGGSAALVATAAWLPLPAPGAQKIALEKPPAWTETAEWIETLDESDVVEPEAIDKVRAQLDELGAQPEDAWYGQSSLEAGDALREQMSQSVAALQRNLQAASHALASAQGSDPDASLAERNALARSLGNAIDGLESGNLPLNPELVGKLKNVDLSRVRAIDPRQLRELRDRLAKGTKACAACVGVKNGEAMIAGARLPEGNGGVDRGPGSPPLGRKPLPTNLHTEATEGLASAGMEQAMPGELLGIEKSAPPPAATVPPTLATAGAISSVGRGGKVVWKNDLTPAEREMLERFFK